MLLLMGAAATMCGCRFWYKPVPVANAIGEERTTIASDSFNVHRGETFEVYGPNPEAVYDGYEQLNRAYRAFERYFGVPGAKVAIIMSTDPLLAIDSAAARSFRERGFTVVRYVRPRSVRTRRSSASVDYGGTLWPVAPTVARAMLAQFARARIAAAGVDSAFSDDALLERFPLWYRAAVMHLVGEPSASNDVDLVRDKRNSLIPIATVMREVRAASGDTLLDPSRRGEADEFTRKLAAQAATISRYLVRQDGPAVLGQFGRGYLARRTLGEMLAELKAAPHSLEEIERGWKLWIEAEET